MGLEFGRKMLGFASSNGTPDEELFERLDASLLMKLRLLTTYKDFSCAPPSGK